MLVTTCPVVQCSGLSNSFQQTTNVPVTDPAAPGSNKQRSSPKPRSTCLHNKGISGCHNIAKLTGVNMRRHIIQGVISWFLDCSAEVSRTRLSTGCDTSGRAGRRRDSCTEAPAAGLTQAGAQLNNRHTWQACLKSSLVNTVAPSSSSSDCLFVMRKVQP